MLLKHNNNHKNGQRVSQPVLTESVRLMRNLNLLRPSDCTSEEIFEDILRTYNEKLEKEIKMMING